MKPKTQPPLVDIVDGTGKCIGAILAEPDRYEGEVLFACTRLYPYSELVGTMSKASEKAFKDVEMSF